MHFIVALATALCVRTATALVGNLPSGIVVDNFATNLGIATDFDWLDQDRIVVSGKRGVLMLIKNGTVMPEPLWDISSKVNYLEDRGMSTVAVHPDFPTQPYVYVGYVFEDGSDIGAPKQNRISRLRVVGDKVTEEVVLFGLCRQMTSAYFGNDCFPIYGNSHAIDQLQFKDGRLFASFGEGELFEGDYWRTRFIKYAPEDWLGTVRFISQRN
jgi:glucose/arabinose dehydrogenase